MCAEQESKSPNGRLQNIIDNNQSSSRLSPSISCVELFLPCIDFPCVQNQMYMQSMHKVEASRLMLDDVPSDVPHVA